MPLLNHACFRPGGPLTGKYSTTNAVPAVVVSDAFPALIPVAGQVNSISKIREKPKKICEPGGIFHRCQSVLKASCCATPSNGICAASVAMISGTL
jgi:hypothetical protein